MYNFIMVLGALILFVYSLKTLSDGLQQAFGNQFRNLMGKTRTSRLKGIFAGLGISASLQSSSITTVMVISYVNSGLINMAQSASVIMGANIGTTITAWIIFLFGFYFETGTSSIILVAIAAPFLFLNSGKIKSLGSILIGLALILISVSLLRTEILNLDFLFEESVLIKEYNEFSFLTILFFALLGALFTIIVQSSAATIALIMTLVSATIIPLELALAMVIGSNVGTTITGELASYRASIDAKRAARIHALFNIIGAIWMIILFPIIFPLFQDILASINIDTSNNPLITSVLGIALFHTLFNALNTIILIWFIPMLIKITEKSIEFRAPKENAGLQLSFIGKGVMSSADLSLLEVKNEIARFGEITSKMSTFTHQLLFEKNAQKQNALYEKIARYEDITDRVEIEVANYLTKISENKQSESSAIRIRSMNSIVNDLESIGDAFYRMSKMIKRKEKERVWFTPEQRNFISEMFKLVDEAFRVMVENLNLEYEDVDIVKAVEVEKRINEKRDQLRKEYIESITTKSEGNLRGGMIYNDMFESIEKVGDHIINVTDAITGKI
jgi:phosphate:Na+ symporter